MKGRSFAETRVWHLDLCGYWWGLQENNIIRTPSKIFRCRMMC